MCYIMLELLVRWCYSDAVFTPVDQPEASAVFHLEQKASAEAAAADDHVSSPRFCIGTGTIIPFGNLSVEFIW